MVGRRHSHFFFSLLSLPSHRITIPLYYRLLLLLCFPLALALVPPVPPSNYGGGGDGGASVLSLPRNKSLRFSAGAGAAFKIAIFADLHYGENAWTDWGPQQDANSDRVLSAVLDKENPDFVIYLGDVVTANNLPIPNASLYWDRAISATRSRGIPWATVFGNHDDAAFEWPSDWFSSSGIPEVRCPTANISSTGAEQCSFRGTPRIDLMNTEINNNRLSYSATGPKELWPSVSNYVLQILSSKEMDPVALLYFLDSGGGSYPEVISNAQAKWFQAQSQIINPNGKVPEIIFWHIPSIAFSKVAPKPNSEIDKPCVGSINLESVAPQDAEWGIMDILAKRPSVKAIFSGHNHGLDWCCPYQKLWLCFARHTGYGGYGDWPRGARIIEITEQPFSLKSWIRMENGTEHSDLILSS
ncbi:probable inactive purple acid phosphatase 16 isoform X1 [Ananas comosus]|uniref:Probable inactive purple acid phosphatase 16 isoform X1 n=1 Tax=Ananas comosus TaxID=4615 RepID=A0A6P5GLS3_ANACO|nr:probable inactive purple acid phosphatase 16 isoform X1 [Ananas comosus]